jgi:hypothetical protein
MLKDPRTGVYRDEQSGLEGSWVKDPDGKSSAQASCCRAD